MINIITLAKNDLSGLQNTYRIIIENEAVGVVVTNQYLMLPGKGNQFFKKLGSS